MRNRGQTTIRNRGQTTIRNRGQTTITTDRKLWSVPIYVGLSAVAILVITLNTLAPGLPITLQPFYMLISLALSCGVGLAAGISPALHAASLNPIDALRSE